MGFLFANNTFKAAKLPNDSTSQRSDDQTELGMNEIHASLKENLRALPRAAWVLFLGSFLNKFGTFVMPFLAIYMTGLGYSATQAGLAIASYGCGVLCASILGGYLGARLSQRMNRTLLRWLVIVVGFSLAAYYFADQWGLLTW